MDVVASTVTDEEDMTDDVTSALWGASCEGCVSVTHATFSPRVVVQLRVYVDHRPRWCMIVHCDQTHGRIDKWYPQSAACRRGLARSLRGCM